MRWSIAVVVGLASAVPSIVQAQPAEDVESDVGASDPVDASPSADGTVPDAPVDAEAESDEFADEGTDAEGDSVVVAKGGLFESADTETASDAGTAPVASPTFDLGGYVRGVSFVSKTPDADRATLSATYGELALRANANAGDRGSAFAELRFQHGQRLDERELTIDLREAYASAYLGPLDLIVGKQIIVWGRADIVNPTNNLMPVDWRVRSPEEDDRRIGNFAVRGILDLAPVKLEGVWVPLYEPVQLPPYRLPLYVAVSDDYLPGPDLANGLGAGRVHLELPAFEASVSYLHGYAPMPGLSLREVVFLEQVAAFGGQSEIALSRTAYRHHVVGLDFSTAIGSALALRGEAAYRMPIDYETKVYAPRPDIQYVFGGDRNFGNVNVIAQYVGRYTLDWERDTPENRLNPTALDRLSVSMYDTVAESINAQLAERNQVLFSQTEEVQHLASLRIEWRTLHEALSLSATSLLNFTTEEWVLFPKVSYNITDQLSTTLGAELYSGPENTLIGLVDQTLTAGYGELQLSF